MSLQSFAAHECGTCGRSPHLSQTLHEWVHHVVLGVAGRRTPDEERRWLVKCSVRRRAQACNPSTHPRIGRSDTQCQAYSLISFLACGANPVCGQQSRGHARSASLRRHTQRPALQWRACSLMPGMMYRRVHCFSVLTSTKSPSTRCGVTSYPSSSNTYRLCQRESVRRAPGWAPAHLTGSTLCAGLPFVDLHSRNGVMPGAHVPSHHPAQCRLRALPLGKPQELLFQPLTMMHLSSAGFSRMAPNTGTVCCTTHDAPPGTTHSQLGCAMPGHDDAAGPPRTLYSMKHLTMWSALSYTHAPCASTPPCTCAATEGTRGRAAPCAAPRTGAAKT